jgi:hypothetical protein
MAALQIISLDTTTPQLRAPASGDTYAAPRAIALTPETLTGSSATSSLSIAQTWNTTGTPTAIDLNVTDTASNASSLLMNLRVGGSNRFTVDKTGAVVISDGSNALTIDSSNGATTFLQTAQMVLQTSNALILRHGNNDGLSIRAVSGAVDPRLDFMNTSNAIQVRLTVDAANTLAQRNGVNAQAFNIYNTFTDASNYERGFVRWSSNRLQVGSEALGTGSQRDLDIQGTSVTVRIGTTNRWFFYASNHFGPAGNATQDFGTSTLRIRDFYQGGFHEMAEQTAPAAPAADRVRIYAEDDGSGKTRLMALFATGAAQQIAIEP